MSGGGERVSGGDWCDENEENESESESDDDELVSVSAI